MKNLKVILIYVVIAISVGVMCASCVMLTRNRAISLEEAVYTAKADVNTEEKRRVDLVYNLADCVKQYDLHESTTLTAIADNMSSDSNEYEATVDNYISAIGYEYPELKSQANYENLMVELESTENKISQRREAYNSCVSEYNRYVKGFPHRTFLSMTEYEVQVFERTKYMVSEDAPQDIFSNGSN